MIRLVHIALTALAIVTATISIAVPVYINTPEGEKRLLSSEIHAPFFSVLPYVETQQNLAFCGPASIVAVMNSLGTPRPPESHLYPYNFYTQDNIFTTDTQRIKSFVMVSVSGMTLTEVASFFNSLGVKATVHHADNFNLDQLRALLKDVLAQPDTRVVANFNRKVLGQDGGGHHSPLAAYDATSDSVLMLDVAKFKYPPAWLPLAELLPAMQSVDSDSGKSRGLVIVKK